MTVAENLKHIRENIRRACGHCGRSPSEVQIVSVTKTVDVSKIEEAIAAGITIIGENRVQEAWQKYQQLGHPVSWHLVGHLQTNKVKRALQFFDVIESVDSIHLAEEIDRRAAQMGRVVEIFVEVNTSGEESKFGVKPEETVEFCNRLQPFQHLRLNGLMTIGAFTSDVERIRACFQLLRRLRTQVQEAIPEVRLQHLSMGMTNDYEIAVEEGATLVRIGRAIFGERA